MPSESSTIVQRLWNYCNLPRDDVVSYGDYVEQLTYLFLLKMPDEQTKPTFNKPSIIPKELDWQSLIEENGDSLEDFIRCYNPENRRNREQKILSLPLYSSAVSMRN